MGAWDFWRGMAEDGPDAGSLRASTIQKNLKNKLMKKFKLSPILAAGVAAAVQIHNDQALASPVITASYTNETSYSSGSSTTVPISPAIANADELVSISEGDASGYESGSFTLTADYSNSTQQQLYTTTSGSLNVQFDTIFGKSFAEGDIDGLTFTVTGNNNESIPAGTVFTFDVVPEPATLALAAMGAAGAWLAVRRRTGKPAKSV